MSLPARWSLLAVCALAALAACSPKRIGINRMADALTATADAYSKDNDPEFVRTAAPATLKMIEMLLDEESKHTGLLLTACRGFTAYAYAFIHLDAEIAQTQDPGRASELRVRARTMYERAREYCLRALDARHPGLRALVATDAQKAVLPATAADVPALYWLAGSWGGMLSLADNQLTRLGELASIRAVLTRALALDEAWQGGAVHEAFIPLDGLPALLGGSATRARQHFDRAVALSEGHSAFAYVAMASSVSLPAHNRQEFERLLRSAIAIDVNRRPDLRLANLIAQRRARFLLSRVDALLPVRR